MMRLGKRKREELLSAYLDGELEADEQARLEARLESDPTLREELDGLRRTVALVRDLPPAPLPRNFILSPGMAAPARPRPRSLPRRLVAVPRMAFSTLVVGLLFVAVLLGDWLTGRPPAAVRVAVTMPQATVVIREMPMGEAGEETFAATAPTNAAPSPPEGEPLAAQTAAPYAGPTATVTPAATPTVAPTSTPTPPVMGTEPGPTGRPSRLWWRIAEVVLGVATLSLAATSLRARR